MRILSQSSGGLECGEMPTSGNNYRTTYHHVTHVVTIISLNGPCYISYIVTCENFVAHHCATLPSPGDILTALQCCTVAHIVHCSLCRQL